MIKEDERELFRLTEMLRRIENSLELESELREPLTKAGLALIHCFNNGLRDHLEKDYNEVKEPLSFEQETILQNMGIDTTSPNDEEKNN